jgi:hypothetical protein
LEKRLTGFLGQKRRIRSDLSDRASDDVVQA